MDLGQRPSERETSLMLALRPDRLKMDGASVGFVGEPSEITAKVFDGIHHLDPNGLLGDPRPATAESGEPCREEIIEFFYQWVRDQG